MRPSTRKADCHDPDRHPLVPAFHRARRHRAVRGAAADPRLRHHVHRPRTRRGPLRQRDARHRDRRDVRGDPAPGHRRVPRRRRHAAVDARRAGARLGADRARDDDVHHVGVHRLAGARRGRAARRADRDDPLERARHARRSTAPSRRASASSSTSTGGSSPPPACRAASTWRCDSSSCSSTAPPPRRAS